MEINSPISLGELVDKITILEIKISKISDNNKLQNVQNELNKLRERRNVLLVETDYLALSDNTLADNMKTYRQELRDLTSGLDTVDKINNVTWPTKPS